MSDPFSTAIRRYMPWPEYRALKANLSHGGLTGNALYDPVRVNSASELITVCDTPHASGTPTHAHRNASVSQLNATGALASDGVVAACAVVPTAAG